MNNSQVPERWLRLGHGEGKGGATETARNYEAFSLYYQTPPSQRSLANIAQRLGKSVRLLERWSVDFYWQERTAAWDRHQEAAALEALEAEQRKQEQLRSERTAWLREKKWSIGNRLFEKVSAMASMPLTEQTTRDGKTIIKPMKWSAAAVPAWIRTAEELCASALKPKEHGLLDGPREEIWTVEDFTAEDAA